jgi:hypothetical protein
MYITTYNNKNLNFWFKYYSVKKYLRTLTNRKLLYSNIQVSTFREGCVQEKYKATTRFSLICMLKTRV